jgi:hypothetical protein
MVSAFAGGTVSVAAVLLSDDDSLFPSRLRSCSQERRGSLAR